MNDLISIGDAVDPVEAIWQEVAELCRWNGGAAAAANHPGYAALCAAADLIFSQVNQQKRARRPI